MMVRRISNLIPALVVVLAAPGLISAQVDRTQGSPKSEVLEVRANVFITDAAGMRTHDVRPEELRLFEDGVEQKITRLIRQPGQLNITFVIDNTGSVREKLESIVRMGKLIVQNLDVDSKTQIIRFVGRDNITTPVEWTSDRTLLNNAFDDLFIEGGASAVTDGVMLALANIKDRLTGSPNERHLIILISDCVDRGSFHNETQLKKELANMQVPVFVIAMTDDIRPIVIDKPPPGFDPTAARKKYERFAHSIGLISGGSVYFPTQEPNRRLPLKESLRSLVYELRSQYVIAYTPANQLRDGKERKLKIEIADGKDGSKRMAMIKPSFIVSATK